MVGLTRPQNITITDLPAECIELFAPDRAPNTISALRLVNRQFRDIFCKDKFYRHYLLYPDTSEIYRQDLEDIGVVEGRWKRCLKNEKKRLANWKNGQPRKINVQQIPGDLYFRRSHVHWKHNGKWMLSEGKHRKIVLQATDGESAPTIIDVSEYTSLTHDFAILANDKVLVRTGPSNGSHVVLNIQNVGGHLFLNKSFNIEEKKRPKGFVINGYIKGTNTFKSLYGSYDSQPTNGCIRFWDLERGVEENCVNINDLTLEHRSRNVTKLKVVHAQFPYVVTCIKLESCGPNATDYISVVNIEQEILVLWEEDVTANLQNRTWTINEDVLILETKHRRKGAKFFRLNGHSCMTGKSGFICEYYEEVGRHVRGYYEPPNKFTVIHVTHPTYNMYVSEYFDGLERPKREVIIEDLQERYTKSFYFRHLNGPVMAIERQKKSKPHTFHLLAVDMEGRELFDWAEMLGVGGSARLEDLKFIRTSLSQCILSNERGDRIFFVKF